MFYLLSSILALRNRALNARLAGHGIDYPRWRVLAVLNEHPGASMLRIAELTSVDRTSLTHTVRMMADEGLVRRERGQDRRSIVLNLTPRGEATFTGILPAVLDLNGQALAGLDSAEVEGLRGQLHRLLDNLKG